MIPKIREVMTKIVKPEGPWTQTVAEEKFGEWLSPDTMKRKLSGLRGALGYMREFYPNRKLDDERMD